MISLLFSGSSLAIPTGKRLASMTFKLGATLAVITSLSAADRIVVDISETPDAGSKPVDARFSDFSASFSADPDASVKVLFVKSGNQLKLCGVAKASTAEKQGRLAAELSLYYVKTGRLTILDGLDFFTMAAPDAELAKADATCAYTIALTSIPSAESLKFAKHKTRETEVPLPLPEE